MVNGIWLMQQGTLLDDTLHLGISKGEKWFPMWEKGSEREGVPLHTGNSDQFKVVIPVDMEEFIWY